MSESCWLINFKNGYKMILSEAEYLKYKQKRNVEQIYTEEHWFIMDNCIKKNPSVEVIK